MSALAYYNGEVTDLGKVRIPLSDRSVFFGDGVYEVMLAGKVKIYQQEQHLKRLRQGAERLGIPVPCDLEATINRMVRLSRFEKCSVYAQLSRSSDTRIHAPERENDPNLLITVSEIELQHTHVPILAKTADDVRYRMCNVKTLNLLPSVLASISAAKNGCDEAIFVRDGIVTEGAKSNLFIAKNGILYTHPNSSFILPGLTRENVLRLAREIGVECREERFGTDYLYSADEVFITSTTKLLRQVREIDGKTIGNGSFPLSSALGSLLYNEAICSIL